MQICSNCGKVFEDDEMVQHRDRETGYHIYVCPWCGSEEINEAQECSICGEYFTEDEVESGFCAKCLYEAIDYEVAHAYMKTHEGWLSQFVVNYLSGETLYNPKSEYDRILEDVFNSLQHNDKDKAFLEACKQFCLPECDDEWLSFGCEGAQFAKWYKSYLKEVNI